MENTPTVTLNTGYEMPVLGLGTWMGGFGMEEEVANAVRAAIDLGYRHIDCAAFYANEAAIGSAIQEKISEGVVKREDLFIVSKVWNNRHNPALVEPTLRQTLEDLQLDYLDLYLMHWPMAFQEGDDPNPVDPETGLVIPGDTDFVDTWRAMEEVATMKWLTRSIGVSNFNSGQLERLLENSAVVPVTNQVECHPYLNQKKLRNFCKSRGITITSYAPLGTPNVEWRKPGDPDVFNDEKIAKIAKEYDKTVAQVLLRYNVQSGNIAIPKSASEARLAENFDIFDFELFEEDVAYLDTFDCNYRVYPFPICVKHPDYPFAPEVEF